MTVEIQRLFEALPPKGSSEELGRVINKIRDVYDLEHVAYLAISLGQKREYVSSAPTGGALLDNGGHWFKDESGVFTTASYPMNWVAHYVDQDYKKIDPTVESALTSFIPLDWKNMPWTGKRRREMLGESISAGLGNQGYTIPIRGPNGQFAMFSINKNCSDEEWSAFLHNHKSDFLIIAHFYHQKALELEGPNEGIHIIKLSDRERDALTFIACGKSRAQVAHDLKISENTIRVYLDSARHKLGALNLPHAIAIAIQKGIINI